MPCLRLSRWDRSRSRCPIGRGRCGYHGQHEADPPRLPLPEDCGRGAARQKPPSHHLDLAAQRKCPRIAQTTGGVANHEGVDVTKTTCPVCDREFMAKGNQRFCPPTQGERDRCGPNTSARSWCAKRYERHVGRGGPLKGQPPQPFNCAECDTYCVQGRDGVDLKARKFCGKDCKREWHRSRQDAESWPSTKERQRRRGEEARERSLSQVKARASEFKVIGQPRQWVDGECKGCGTRFVASKAASWLSHYCSETCGNRDARARRRARKRQAWVEDVWRPILFERDGWTCQLCGDPVDPDLKYPDDQCATVDHIVPLNMGGKHSYANTQLAHALCNALKGDREAGSMMFAA